MCVSFKSLARKSDLFGSPIGVTYKKEYSYQTFVGGCASIFLIFIFGGNLILSILGVWISPTYSSKNNSTYNNFAETAFMQTNLVLSTQNQTVAGGISLTWRSE